MSDPTIKQNQDAIEEVLAQQTTDISIVIPVYNEEDNLNELNDQLHGILKPLNRSYEIIFVNDGSKDKSFEILQNLNENNKGVVKVIHLSRNFGHQLALTAGINFSRGKATIIMDADLQDPPEVILDFIKKWDEGYEIVYGLRKKREGETFFKLFTARMFYKLILASHYFNI